MKGFTIDTNAKNQEMIAAQGFELAHQKGIVEALIFAAYEPIQIGQLAETANLTESSIEKLIDELNDDYATTGRSFRIENVGGGFKMFTLPEYHHFINRANHREKRLSLTRASLETLAIVGYKQPVTKAEIERIRGVDCDGVLRNLTARGLIRIDGRSSAPGKPLLYSTAEYFLEFFGLSSIDDLPPLPPLEQLKESLPKLKLTKRGEGEQESDLFEQVSVDGNDLITNQDAAPDSGLNEEPVEIGSDSGPYSVGDN